MKKIIYLLTLSIYGLSCTWDKLPMDGDPLIPCDPVITLSLNGEDTCFEFEPDFDNLSYEIYDQQFGWPSINPLNSNEIILAYNTDTISPPYEFHYLKINFCTGERTIVYPVLSTIGQAKWSKKDWVVMGSDGSIYTMKSNGDSVTYINAIAGIPVLNNATWIESGEKIFCYAGSGIESNVILNKNGYLLDTIPYRIGAPSSFGVNIAGYRFVDGNIYITVYNLYTKLITDLAIIPYYDPSENFVIYSVDWLNANEIIWSDTKKINKVNIADGNIINIKESCDSRQYGPLSTSPQHNGDFIVAREKTNVANDTAYIKREILKINAYSGEEWIVNLEQ